MIQNNLKSLGVFVGTGHCNANCKHCADIPHRKFAPKYDNTDNFGLIQKTLIDCFNKNVRKLSLSSSGEPTLSPKSVTTTLEIIQNCSKYKNDLLPLDIHLYTNGIRIGINEEFCKKYLFLWKSLGLNTIYLTVHSTNDVQNAKICNIESYPNIQTIVERIHNANITIRANIVLSKLTVRTVENCKQTINDLYHLNIDSIAAWPLRDANDVVDIQNSFSKYELDQLQFYINTNNLKHFIKIYSQEDEHKKSYETKLTLFPDGTLSNTWCK